MGSETGWREAVLEHTDGLILRIELQPAARRQGLLGYNKWRNRLQFAVRAVAVDSAANSALVQVLGDLLEIQKKQISLTSGQRDRRKQILIKGVDSEQIQNRLSQLLDQA